MQVTLFSGYLEIDTIIMKLSSIEHIYEQDGQVFIHLSSGASFSFRDQLVIFINKTVSPVRVTKGLLLHSWIVDLIERGVIK